MTAKDRQEIKDRVEKEIQTLNRSIAMLLDLTKAEVQSDANDWFSSKESNPGRAINEQALGKAKQRLLILQDVLKRIDRAGYGICYVCKQPIPAERLKAVPTAIRCISC
ncbi:MAG: TraR/DksA C4-type zinc finger protein [Bacteroidales bacterium]